MRQVHARRQGRKLSSCQRDKSGAERGSSLIRELLGSHMKYKTILCRRSSLHDQQLSQTCSSTKCNQFTVNIMSLEQVPTSRLYVGEEKTPSQHPLGPLTASEISRSVSLIKELWPPHADIQFKTITLQEPEKAEVVPFLAAEHAGQQTPFVERRSFVIYYLRNTVSLHVVQKWREALEE